MKLKNICEYRERFNESNLLGVEDRRIIDFIGQNGNKVNIRTFHSFCFQMIKEERKRNLDIL